MGIFIVVVLFIAAIIYYASQEHASSIAAEKKRVDDLEKARIYHEAIEVATERIQSIIAQHIRTLAVKYDQTIYQDAYGNHLFDKWFQEVDYFIDNVLRKDRLISEYLLPPYVIQTRTALRDPNFWKEEENQRLLQIINKVGDVVDEYKAHQLENNAHLSVDVDSLDPIQFEHYCAEILRGDGWDARVTKASGDQGVDVIAHLGDFKAVLQCKKYSQPVGNAAVQEIFAGKQHEQAHVAAVVSNATFTPSAKQLAATTGVHLLHYSELPQLAERLGLAS